jgi:hypothetical protein
MDEFEADAEIECIRFVMAACCCHGRWGLQRNAECCIRQSDFMSGASRDQIATWQQGGLIWFFMVLFSSSRQLLVYKLTTSISSLVSYWIIPPFDTVWEGWPNLLNTETAYDNFLKFGSHRQTWIGAHRYQGTAFLCRGFVFLYLINLLDWHVFLPLALMVQKDLMWLLSHSFATPTQYCT